MSAALAAQPDPRLVGNLSEPTKFSAKTAFHSSVACFSSHAFYDGSISSKHDGSPLEPRRDLREQLQPLASERGFEVGEAGNVPTRLVEPRDEVGGDGIAHARHDWDRPRLPLNGSGHRGPKGHDDVGLQADQLLRERSHPI